jgi:predicted transcriptional regulator
LTATHEIICADLSLNNVTDSEAFPGLIRQTHRKIRAASADGAYDTRSVTMNCGVRKSARLSHPEKVRVTGPVNMQTVTVQWLISG